MQARASTREIIPQLPVNLGGYSGTRVARAVETPLEVNCVCLDDGSSRIVLISLDLLYVTSALRQSVLKAVADLKLGDSDVFMAASHTHGGPAIDATKPGLGTIDPGCIVMVAERVADAVRDAVTGPKLDVTLSFAQQGSAPIGINRRSKRLLRYAGGRIEVNKVGMGPNPHGPIDPTIWVGKVSAGERIVAYLWSGACHPTAVGPSSAATPDWPGVVRDRLRAQARGTDTEKGSNDQQSCLPVLFFQGFCGDVRPPSGTESTLPWWRLAANRIRLGRTFRPMGRAEFQVWSSAVSSSVVAVASACTSPVECDVLDAKRLEVDAQLFAVGASDHPPVTFHRVSLGTLVLAGASAEIVSGYAERVRALADDRTIVPVSCIDHVVGYWPLHHMLKEGGYEVVHHCPAFGIESCSPEIERTVLECFTQLLTA